MKSLGAAYGVPPEDWAAPGAELMGRVAALIRSIAAGDPVVHVVDTLGTLTPASTDEVGPGEHWQNEIHPTRAGYRLLGDRWERELRRLFCGG